jgi:peptidoglycan/LPS O-acetylase OafA/YrhL
MTLAWFVASVVYMLTTHILELGHNYRYYYLLSGTLPFSIGALIFHYYNSIKRFIPNAQTESYVAALLSFFMLNAAVAVVANKLALPEFVTNFSFYLNFAINAAVVIFLIDGRFPLVSKFVDKKIGDYSYPLYLMHWPVGFAASMLLWSEPVTGHNIKGFLSLGVTLVICVILATLTIKYIDEPVERLRKAIKQSSKKAGRRPGEQPHTVAEPVVGTAD